MDKSEFPAYLREPRPVNISAEGGYLVPEYMTIREKRVRWLPLWLWNVRTREVNVRDEIIAKLRKARVKRC